MHMINFWKKLKDKNKFKDKEKEDHFAQINRIKIIKALSKIEKILKAIWAKDKYKIKKVN